MQHKFLRTASISLGLFLFMIGMSYGDYQGTETCSMCHSDIYESWRGSIHANAYASDSFQKAWNDHNQDPACLNCHTTGHKGGTADFMEAGVTCESCHGPMSEGHPDTDKMPIPIASEMCESCHKQTFQEWQLSKHGTMGIRCFDCHQVHAQGLRAGGGDNLCGSCHQNRLSDFAHSTHHLEGLKCSTCHMPHYKTHETRIEGTGAAGHTLSVGAEVCSRCHETSVHKSASLPELREKVTEINQQMFVAGIDNVFDLNESVKNLTWRLNRAHQGMWVAGLLFFIIGLSLGWLGGWYLYARRKNRSTKSQ